MVTLGIRLFRAGLLALVLALLPVMSAWNPSQAIARPASEDGLGGETGGTGDPTGDDLPSPTPKPGSKAAKWDGGGVLVANGGAMQRGGFYSTYRWNLYWRLVIRLGIR